jgi:UDP-2-acetamido-3-amino-2,3-dideoxy-glucuronate N-acetyltransferase
METNAYFAHPTAVIDEGCTIGKGTKIWHFCHVQSGARLGQNCILGQNVNIANDVIIGNRVKIQNNVSIYEGVELEDDVFCGPSCVFTNVNNPRAEIVRKNEYRLTLVKRGTTIGANATIVCGHTLGEYSFIAAGAVVGRETTHDVVFSSANGFEFVAGQSVGAVGTGLAVASVSLVGPSTARVKLTPSATSDRNTKKADGDSLRVARCTCGRKMVSSSAATRMPP